MKSEAMKLCRVGALAGLTALLVACGDDVTNTDVTNVTGAKTVADLAAAGTCDDSAQGEIVLNEDDGALYVCNGKKWTTMKGDAGDAGEAGASCTAVAIAGVGIEVSCDGAIVDTLKNGAKGDAGEAGTVCTGRKIAEGYELTCDGAVVDTLRNGAKGDAGEAGTVCTGRKIAEGYELTCDGAVVDTL
ncbi:MAG: hypothetical protein J6Y56_09115, partial [Fibrobacterales bacterium]|nr:hypothetical protein [Fibrobacterales bacterium]